jgi:hypothetical protein
MQPKAGIVVSFFLFAICIGGEGRAQTEASLSPEQVAAENAVLKTISDSTEAAITEFNNKGACSDSHLRRLRRLSDENYLKELAPVLSADQRAEIANSASFALNYHLKDCSTETAKTRQRTGEQGAATGGSSEGAPQDTGRQTTGAGTTQPIPPKGQVPDPEFARTFVPMSDEELKKLEHEEFKQSLQRRYGLGSFRSIGSTYPGLELPLPKDEGSTRRGESVLELFGEPKPPSSLSTGPSDDSLTEEQKKNLRALPVDPLPKGTSNAKKDGSPPSGTKRQAVKTVKQQAPAQTKGAAQNNELGQQLMQGLIQGGIQYGIGRAIGGGGGSERSHSNAPAAQKGGHVAKPQGTTAVKPGAGAAPSGGVMFYGVTGPSDVRLKRDVRPLARHDSGVMLYRFRYLWSDTEYVGVMAQEVALIRADAVLRGADGFLRVDYGKLGTRLMTWEEWQGPALAQFTGAVQR